MRIHTPVLALALFASTVTAQTARMNGGLVAQHMNQLRTQGTSFRPMALLRTLSADPDRDASWQGALDHATLFAPDRAVFASVVNERPTYVTMPVTMEHGGFQLDLERTDPFTDDFSVVVASTGEAFPYTQGAYYRGSVRGQENSLVAISVFKDELMGFISTPEGEWTIGRMDGDANGTHVLYRTSDLHEPPMLACSTVDDGEPYTHEQLTAQGDGRTVKCVRIYWEVNYDIFQGKGSVASATNYVTGLFNQSQILYNNDGISVSLSQVYVWDVASPYTSTSTSTLLDQFGAYRTSFNGDIANLLGYAGGGGIAWLSGLCTGNIAHRMGYSGISSSFQNVPTFSWSVEVVTHEQGHIMGSKHTHACAWNGNNTAIDGCGPAAGYSEGSCTAGPLPSGGGTIMSYCHLVSGVGINFNNGFGPQPIAVIVNNINNASCLSACSGTTCAVPTGLNASGVTTTSATLTWAAVSGATSYSLQWKPSTSSTWTTVTGLTSTTYALNGLSSSTAYQFQVSTVCSGGSSAYATAVTFTTTGTTGCPDIQEPNNTQATAGTITSGATYNALIASSTDADYYKLITTATTNITLSLSNLPFDYDVRLLNSGGTQVATSTNGNTTAESISYANAAAGTYYVHVYGYNGATSTAQCYALTVTATVVQQSCTDNREPNQTNGAAWGISANNTITAKIGASTDVDWFRFANTSAQKYIKVTLTNLPANYDMKLYRSSGLLVTSSHTGTTNEQIIYNSTTVSSNYKVNVYGVGGAFNASSCYTLTVQLSATPFQAGQEPEGSVAAEVEPVQNDFITAFPNPANDQLTVLIPASDKEVQVQLLDAMGRVLNTFSSQVTGADQRIVMDTNALTSGIYFVRALREEDQRMLRVSIQH